MTTFTKMAYDEYTQITWYNISGIDYGTTYNFGLDGECFAITKDNRILDIDGAPMTEGDFLTIAVRNALNI